MDEKTLPPSSLSPLHDPATLKLQSVRNASFYAQYLLPGIRATDHILDVGCGPGTITFGLAEKASEGLTIGIDSSATAIEVAKRAAGELGIFRICTFRVGNAYDGLEWPDGTFDIVHSHQCFMHLAEPVRAFAEMRRVCKVGGVVAAKEGDFGAFTVYPETPALLKFLTISDKAIREAGGDPHAGRRLMAWARQAGYQREELRVSCSVEVYATRPEREFIAARWQERLLYSTIGSTAMKLGISTDEENKEIARAWRNWVENVDGFFAMPSTEILCWKSK